MDDHDDELSNTRRRKYLSFQKIADFLHTYPNDHPLQISLRTYALSLSLSLVPALVTLLTSGKLRRRGSKGVLHILRRELGASGFAFAITVGVGGGAALKHLSDIWQEDDVFRLRSEQPNQSVSVSTRIKLLLSALKDSQKTFLANAISASFAIYLLQSRKSRRPPNSSTLLRYDVGASRTLDLTLVLLVRAMDAVVRAAFFPVQETFYAGESAEATKKEAKARERRQQFTSRLDSLVFWACSARIMWCFFYKPERLPSSYNKWIMALANIDPRILAALRAIRNGNMSYIKGACVPPDLLSSFATDLGYPREWGNISRIPAYGGASASAAWKSIGVPNRNGLGGIPCELVHGGITGGSCTSNVLIRGAQAFAEAILIYLPVHFLPILLTRPRRLLRPSHLVTTLLSVFRSASFLSAFVSSIWAAVCLTRTVLLARLFPFVPHDFWDGPFGCTFAGSLVCGASIWIEQGRRRGEIALYVLPRALRSMISSQWLRGSSVAKTIERIVFVLSLATLLTASTFRPDSLRGLSRWTLSFVMSGPNAGFWKKRRAETTTTTPVQLRSPNENRDTTSAPSEDSS